MRVALSNKNYPELRYVVITFPIMDKDYDACIAALDRLGIGDVRFHDCYVEDIRSGPPSLDFLKGTLVNLDELDFLARSLDRYTDQEMAQFQCMVATRENWDMDTLINLSFSCDQVTVITDFSKLASVGRQHYLNQFGCAPADTMQQLDGEEIARSMIADCEGKITPYGVVYNYDILIDPVYLGRSFPIYSDKEYLLQADYDTPLEGKVSIFLPQPEQRLIRLLERSGIRPEGQADIGPVTCDFPDSVMDRVVRHPENIFEINRLAASLEKLDEGQAEKYAAVVEYAQPEYPFQMRQLAENLDLFDFIPGIKSAEDYGRYMIQESGYFEYDENLDLYYDYEQYGVDHISQKTGQFTKMGYVAYRGMLSLDELMMEAPTEQSSEIQMMW